MCMFLCFPFLSSFRWWCDKRMSGCPFAMWKCWDLRRCNANIKVCRRTITNKRAKQMRKNARKHRFNEVRQLPTFSRQKGRVILFKSLIQVTINRENTPLYIARESMKKKNQKIWNQIRYNFRIQIRISPYPYVGRPTEVATQEAVDRALTASYAVEQTFFLDDRPGSRRPPSGMCCSLLVGRLGGRPTPSSLSSLHFCA